MDGDLDGPRVIKKSSIRFGLGFPRPYLSPMEKQIAEAKKQFVKGFKFYDLYYPKSQSVQVKDGVFVKHAFPNLLWVTARTSFGEVMDVVIYDHNGNKWAEVTPLYVAPPKVLTINHALQVAKGHMVKFKAQDVELVGKIIKYPSNVAIVVETNSGEHTISKADIISIISK